jgi:hypothetical protein
MWNPELEAMPREHLPLLQLERLRSTVGVILAAGMPLAQRQ